MCVITDRSCVAVFDDSLKQRFDLPCVDCAVHCVIFPIISQDDRVLMWAFLDWSCERSTAEPVSPVYPVLNTTA